MRISSKYLFVFLAFLFTLACIYALNSWHQQRLIKEPLAEALLKVEGVNDVNLIYDGRKEAKVYITLGEEVNLPKTYGYIEEALFSTYKQDSFEIIIVDNRNPYLESVYSKVHFALMEGERCGNYGAMSKEIFVQLEQEDGLKNYRLWVDQKRIYLMLATAENNLYEVVPVRYAVETG